MQSLILRGKFKFSSKRFFSTTVSKSMPGGSGLLVATTATAVASTAIAVLLVRLATSAAIIGLSYAAFLDNSVFITSLTVGQRIVLVVDEERMNYLINNYMAQTDNIQANLNEVLSRTGSSLVEVKSFDWREFTPADHNQMVDHFNNLIDYTDELRTLSQTAVKAALDLKTMREVGLNAIQAGDPDITSRLDVLYETAVSLGRDTVLSLGTLTSNLMELDAIINVVRGMISMGTNPFL